MRSNYTNDFRGYSCKEITLTNYNLSYKTKSQRKDILDKLAVDFFYRCGYCGWKSKMEYDSKPFHIDHFDPNKKGTDEDIYKEYVYSCQSCNNIKWSKKIDLDPRKKEFNEAFLRDKSGAIKINNNIDSILAKKAKTVYDILKYDRENHKIDYLIIRIEEALNFIINKESKEFQDCERYIKLSEAKRKIIKVFNKKR